MAKQLNWRLNAPSGGNDVEKPFQCTECDLRFTTNAARNIHSKTHKADETFACNKCKFKTNNYKVFRKHRFDECSLQTYECDKCDKTYSSLVYLSSHMKTHQTKFYQCNDCDFKTANNGSFQRHMSRQHPPLEELGFACADCDYMCASKDDIQRHIAEEHTEEIDDPVEEQDMSTLDGKMDDVSNIDGEIDDVSNIDGEMDDVYACPLCDYADPDANKIEIHMQDAHLSELSEQINKNLKGDEQSLDENDSIPHEEARSDMFTCPLCDHLDTDGGKIEMHIREAHGVNMPSCCMECDFECFDQAELITHMSQEHGDSTDKEMLTCTKCEFSTASEDDLENHIYDTHTRIKSELAMPCTLCDFKSIYNDELEKHIFDVHTAGLELATNKASGHAKVISKLYSGKKLSKMNQIKASKQVKISAHAKAHREIIDYQADAEYMNKKKENEKLKSQEWIEQFYKNKGINWKCDVCNEYFITKQGLNQHKTHTHMQLECEECHISYRTLAGLQRHIAKEHTSADEVSCPECDFKCATEEDLLGHILVHRKCRFMCPGCEASYDDKTDLTNHMLEMNHTGNKPHSCTECREEFLTHAALNIHMKVHDSKTQYSLEDPALHTADNNACDGEIDDKLVYIDNAVYINDPSSIHNLKSIDDLENAVNPEYYDDSDCESDPNYDDRDRESDNKNILHENTNENFNTVISQENTNDENKVINGYSTVNNIENKSQETIEIRNTQEFARENASIKVKETKLVWGFEKNKSVTDLDLVDQRTNLDIYDDIDSDRHNSASKRQNENSEKRKADESFEGPVLKEIRMLDEDDFVTNETEEFENMEVLYTCIDCEYVGTKQGLTDHSKANACGDTINTLDREDMEIIYSCSECDYVGNINGLQVHSRTHQKRPDPFSCDKCNFTCIKESTLDTHFDRHHSKEEYFNCTQCDFQSTSTVGMKIHAKVHKEKDVKEKKVKRKKRRIVAIPYIADPSKSSEQIQVSNENVRNGDVTDTNKVNRKIVALPMMQNSTVSEDSNDFESASSGEGKAALPSVGKTLFAKYQCKFCSYVAVNRRGLSVHMGTVHGVKSVAPVYPRGTWVGLRQYACEICDYIGESSADISAHFRAHIGDKPFGCPECSARFTKKSSLQIHVACHIEEKPYSCIYDGCKYATKLKLNLNTHYAKHRANERKMEKLEQKHKGYYCL